MKKNNRMMVVIWIFIFGLQHWMGTVTSEVNIASLSNGATCTANKPGCDSLIDWTIQGCQWTQLESGLELNITFRDIYTVKSLIFIYCDDSRMRGVGDLLLTFDDGSSQLVTLQAWENSVNHIIFEAVYISPVSTKWVHFTLLSSPDTMSQTTLAFRELAIYEDRVNSVGQALYGATCTSNFPGCQRAIDGNIGYGPGDKDKIWTFPNDINYHESEQRNPIQANVTFMKPYTLYTCRFYQLYELFPKYSICNVKDIELRFDDGTIQKITLQKCGTSGGNHGNPLHKNFIHLKPVKSRMVTVTVKSYYTEGGKSVQGFAEIQFFAGSDYVEPVKEVIKEVMNTTPTSFVPPGKTAVYRTPVLNNITVITEPQYRIQPLVQSKGVLVGLSLLVALILITSLIILIVTRSYRKTEKQLSVISTKHGEENRKEGTSLYIEPSEKCMDKLLRNPSSIQQLHTNLLPMFKNCQLQKHGVKETYLQIDNGQVGLSNELFQTLIDKVDNKNNPLYDSV